MVQKIFEVIRAVAAQGMTILLIEQNARLALLLDDPKVRAAYFGE